MYVDSHCHLGMPELRDRIVDLRREMAAARVDRALCICTTLDDFESVHALATTYDDFWCTVGVHPDEEDATEPTLADLTTRARRPRVVAIGETGLDYYRLNGRGVDEMGWQRDRFRTHIRAALELDLPLVVHTRSASRDTLDLLEQTGERRARGVFHCFTETMDVATAALDLGFYISFSGILTFKNAGALRDVARAVPLDRCLIETDSPYLAPVPHRGKTNQPAYVPHVAAQIAQLKGLGVEEVARATTANFERLFGIAPTGAAAPHSS